MTKGDELLLRIAKFIPPDGWVAWWFLPSEARVYYAQRVILLEENREREQMARAYEMIRKPQEREWDPDLDWGLE